MTLIASKSILNLSNCSKVTQAYHPGLQRAFGRFLSVRNLVWCLKRLRMFISMLIYLFTICLVSNTELFAMIIHSNSVAVVGFKLTKVHSDIDSEKLIKATL